jgi:hypothetical protein
MSRPKDAAGVDYADPVWVAKKLRFVLGFERWPAELTVVVRPGSD